MKVVAISDTHGKLNFKVPPCDLLIHAGDVCPDFAPGSSWGGDMQLQWLKSKFINWFDAQDAASFYFTLGNHDFLSRVSDYGPDLRARAKLDSLVEIYTEDAKLVKIWFSPWSNEFGSWAWMLPPELLAKKYAEIPDDVDIIVSHQPPYGFGDEIPEQYLRFQDDGDRHVGSKQLLETIKRVKPSHVICGHIHNGRGDYQYYHENGTITTVYNAAMVNEQYQRVYEPVEFEL